LFEKAVYWYSRLSSALPAMSRKFTRQAFVMSELGRARALLEALGPERAHRSTQGDALVTQRKQLVDELTQLDDRSGEQAQRILQQIRAIRSQITDESSAIPALSGSQLPSPERICATIPQNSALIEFMLSERGSLLFIFVLTSAGV